MSDMLLFEGYATDGLPTITVDTSVGYYLAPGFSFGDLLLTGLIGDRYADRVMTLPLVVTGAGRVALQLAVEDLVQALSRPYFQMTWTPDAGLPLVFDCRDAQITNSWDLKNDHQGVRNVSVTFIASALGASPSTAEVASGVTNTGSRWMALAPTGVKGSAPGLVTDVEMVGTDLGTSLFHISPAGRNANPPAALTNLAPNQYDNVNALLYDQEGTFTVFVSLGSTPAVGAAVSLSLDIEEHVGGVSGDYTGVTSLSYVGPVTAFMNLTRYVPLGTVTLPLGDSLGGVRSYYLGAGTSSLLPQDVLLLHVDGTTIIRATRAGGAAPTHAYIAPPTIHTNANRVMQSTTTPYRARSASVDQHLVISGPVAQVYPQTSVMLLHAPKTASPTFTATYQPRWLSERTV